MKTLKRILPLTVAVLFLNISALADQPTPHGLDILPKPVPLPKINIIDPTGKEIPLTSFQNKTVVLNVWATWCAPCIREMPSLDRLAGHLNSSSAVVLAVSQDRGGQAVIRPFLERLGVKNLKAFGDPSGKLSRDLGIRGLPSTFIISPGGAIISRVEGAIEWDSPDVIDYIRNQTL